MKDFIISTDSTADLPDSFINEHNIAIHPLYYMVDGVQYAGTSAMNPESFYGKMREGAIVSTSATNPEAMAKVFENQVKEGFDILHLSFSSGLSCSYNNAAVAAMEVNEAYPEAHIEVIDTLAASLGQGLLVYYAVKMHDEGRSLSEVVEWINRSKLHVCHQFTVDDLNFLHKGGRISKAVAILGSLINVKPVLHVDNEGHLIPLTNVRGRKKSLVTLVDNMAEHCGGCINEAVFISHADCPEDAQFVAELVKERFGIETVIINYVSPTIGAHCGPGTVALFHLGTVR